jgi:hypothetical protein
MRSATVGKLPRRRAWRVRIEKNASTRFSQEPEVGVKCRVIRGCRASQARTAGCFVGGVVVDHHVQLPARISGGDLLEEREELLVAVPRRSWRRI